MSWTRKLAFLAIIWTVALAVLLAGTELFLRATEGGWGKTMRLNLVRSRTYDLVVSSVYDSKTATIRYQRDKYGLRDDCVSPAAIDILTLGGSTTDQRFIAEQDSYQAVMESDLSRAAGRKVCVSNAGVDGHSTYGHLDAFRDWFPLIPGLKPKIFLFYIGINDADFTRTGPAVLESEVGLGRARAIKQFRVVQLALWFRDTMESAFGHRVAYANTVRVDLPSVEFPETGIRPETPERAARNAAAFRERLRQMLRFAHASGGDVLCVTQPHRMVRSTNGKARGIAPFLGGDAYGKPDVYGGLDYDYSLRLLNRVMLEECGKDRLVDIYSTDFDDSDFYDFVHNTPSGTRKIGHRIASFIEGSDLMDEFKTRS